MLKAYFKNKNFEDMVVVASDAGSSKKAYKYSRYFNCPLALIDKRRNGNNDSAIATNVIGDIKGKTAIIFDDEVSTAGTLIEAANILIEHGAKEVYARSNTWSFSRTGNRKNKKFTIKRASCDKYCTNTS